MRALLEDALDGDPQHRGIAALFVDSSADSFASVGVRGHEGEASIERASAFPIGSVSKTFAGLLLAESVRRGEIAGLHEPISRVWKDKLTLPRGATRELDWDDLATHRSGFPFFPTNWSAGNELHRAGYTMDEFREYLARAKLESEPGAKTLYGNTGYGLLAMSLAELTGETYADLLRKRIFDPLGMTGSSFPDHEKLPPAGYVEGWGTKCQPQPWRWDPTPMGPCCVIRSTLSDLAQLARALMKPGTPFQEDFRAIAEPRTPAPWGLGESFGLGITVSPTRGLAWKDGQVEGVRTFLLLEPAKQRALVLVASSYRVDVGDLAFRLWSIITDDPSGALQTSTAVKDVPPDAHLVGERLSDDMVLEAVSAPRVAAPGDIVTTTLFLKCDANGKSPTRRPYRVYSDAWLGAELGRIVRSQYLANGARCESDGARFRHVLSYALPRSSKLTKADVWVGLVAVDHDDSGPNAAAESTQRRRAARIIVVDPAQQPLSTWGR